MCLGFVLFQSYLNVIPEVCRLVSFSFKMVILVLNQDDQMFQVWCLKIWFILFGGLNRNFTTLCKQVCGICCCYVIFQLETCRCSYIRIAGRNNLTRISRFLLVLQKNLQSLYVGIMHDSISFVEFASEPWLCMYC